MIYDNGNRKFTFSKFDTAINVYDDLIDDTKCIYKVIKYRDKSTGMYVYDGIYMKGNDLYNLAKRNYLKYEQDSYQIVHQVQMF